jgi:uncharacterized membrane protein
LLRALAGPFFIVAGVLHFLRPSMYEAIMPPWLPAHTELVYASGVAEMASGALLLAPSPHWRRIGGWAAAATMVAVFPANIHMAVNPEEFPSIPRWTLLVRLPLQALVIWWALAAGKRE